MYPSFSLFIRFEYQTDIEYLDGLKIMYQDSRMNLNSNGKIVSVLNNAQFLLIQICILKLNFYSSISKIASKIIPIWITWKGLLPNMSQAGKLMWILIHKILLIMKIVWQTTIGMDILVMMPLDLSKQNWGDEDLQNLILETVL